MTVYVGTDKPFSLSSSVSSSCNNILQTVCIYARTLELRQRAYTFHIFAGSAMRRAGDHYDSN